VILDTAHFKGNAPGSCTLELAHAPGASLERLTSAAFPWQPMLPETRLEPDHEHAFEPAGSAAARPASPVCLPIHPDGGVARLRLLGRVNAAGRRALVLRRLNTLVPEAAERELAACLAGPTWARAVAAARPFEDEAALAAAAERAMASLGDSDWSAAFASPAKIGPPNADRRGWCSGEPH